MPANRKPRKSYRPRPVDPLAHDTAQALATVLRPEQKAVLATPATTALARLRMCEGSAAAWRDMADAMNVAEQLALRGIASDRMAEFQQAQAALHAVHTRATARGTYALRGVELAALDKAVELHLIQLSYCTQGELRNAINAVRRRVSQALAGNAPRDALVCVGALDGAGTR